MPRLCEVYPGIYLTTEEKARKNLSQGREQNMNNYKKTNITIRIYNNNKNMGRRFNGLKRLYEICGGLGDTLGVTWS